MKEKDPNYLVKLEKAIAEKYGDDAVINPKSLWDTEKEKEYLKQLKEEQVKKKKDIEDKKKVENKGFYISKDLISRDVRNICPMCEKYFLYKIDELYFIKYECCQKCYIKYVEGREKEYSTKGDKFK